MPKQWKRAYLHGLPPEPASEQCEGVEGAALLDLWFGKSRLKASERLQRIINEWVCVYFKDDVRSEPEAIHQAKVGWKKSGRKPV